MKKREELIPFTKVVNLIKEMQDTEAVKFLEEYCEQYRTMYRTLLTREFRDKFSPEQHEKELESYRRYYAKNKERISAKRKEIYAKNKKYRPKGSRPVGRPRKVSLSALQERMVTNKEKEND